MKQGDDAATVAVSDPQQESPSVNTTSRRIGDLSGLPAGAGPTRDFVAVDDSGEFSYHRSEQDLMTAFEYVEEAACIIDRSGSAYRLALDPSKSPPPPQLTETGPPRAAGTC